MDAGRLALSEEAFQIFSAVISVVPPPGTTVSDEPLGDAATSQLTPELLHWGRDMSAGWNEYVTPPMLTGVNTAR
jgi:hypothetical protein